MAAHAEFPAKIDFCRSCAPDENFLKQEFQDRKEPEHLFRQERLRPRKLRVERIVKFHWSQHGNSPLSHAPTARFFGETERECDSGLWPEMADHCETQFHRRRTHFLRRPYGA